jgi:hypothetical protein
MTKTLETEKAGNDLHIFPVGKDSRLGVSARIHGVRNAVSCFVVHMKQRMTLKVQVNTWPYLARMLRSD